MARRLVILVPIALLLIALGLVIGHATGTSTPRRAVAHSSPWLPAGNIVRAHNTVGSAVRHIPKPTPTPATVAPAPATPPGGYCPTHWDDSCAEPVAPAPPPQTPTQTLGACLVTGSCSVLQMQEFATYEGITDPGRMDGCLVVGDCGPSQQEGIASDFGI